MRAACCASSAREINLVSGSFCKFSCSCFYLDLDGRCCKCSLEDHWRDCSVIRSSSLYFIQHTRALPLSSSTSCFSGCGNFLVDMNLHIRENGNGAPNTTQQQPNDSTLHSQEIVGSDIIENINNLGFHVSDSLDGEGKVLLAEDTSASAMLESHGDSDDKIERLTSLEEVRSIIDGDESDNAENANHSSNMSFLSTTESDPSIWVPPVPLDIEDDMDSVANNDDDEYYDGTKWGQSGNFSDFDAEHGSSFKEERQKAMMEAMNGQFKILVSRFLASEDISFSEGGHGEKWLDIVASLSWEAALLIKPEASEGKAMDPGSYVKVKCVASGARSQSEVISGLVFKRHTAHKHMPIKCKNPRLLLLKGVLGHRDVGLSSFDSDSMQQEKDYLKSIHEMIDKCQPNVVLVEKSVSRDMQEFLLAKGVTLIFDMKLTRLSRIARCIGSPLISCADILRNPKLMKCDMFHIEKFFEEHNGSNEGGHRSSKTLMFLEGFPKPLGCTILLKGAPILELKKVKRVLQYTIFAAHHLILETSFFADQRALFSHTHRDEHDSPKDNLGLAGSCSDLGHAGSFGDASNVANFCILGNPVGTTQGYISNVPSSNGSLENSIHEDVYCSAAKSNGSSQFSANSAAYEDNHGGAINDKLNSAALPHLPWQVMSSFSSSLKKFLSDSFAPVDCESSYYGFGEELLDSHIGAISSSIQAHEHGTEANSGSIQDKPNDEIPNTETVETMSNVDETTEHDTDLDKKLEIQNKDNVESVLDPQSILVLTSSQCTEKGVVCEQSHLSRIKFYGNFDVSLGHYLQDTLLNQNYRCSSCSEPPEAHVYCYTHQNGNLTVQVKLLPPGPSLSGEAEGKIWMWTRCLKCEQESGVSRPTPRVVMSTAARGLSLGKFLELSFSSHTVASRLSSRCGHSLHRDCLRFFGLGSKVVMFKYSAVNIYAACKPPPVIDFCNPRGREWIKREARLVLQKGDLLFSEVANFLRKLKHEEFGLFQKQHKNFPSSIKDICEVEEMLIQDKSEFEASLLKAFNFTGQLGKAGNEIISLGWLNQELLLELYIWDCRLHSLLQYMKDNESSHEIHEKSIQDNPVASAKNIENNTKNDDMDIENSIQDPSKTVESLSSSPSFHAEDSDSVAPAKVMKLAEISENGSRIVDAPVDSAVADLQGSIENDIHGAVTVFASPVENQTTSSGQLEVSLPNLSNDGNHEGRLSSADGMQADLCSPAPVEQVRPAEEIVESELKIDYTSSRVESSAISMIHKQHPSNSVSQDYRSSKPKDPNAWIWDCSIELRRSYRRDLLGGFLQKFEYIRSYVPEHLPLMQLSTEEKESLHFPLGVDGSVISVYEDDISSIIACSLVLSEDEFNQMENTVEKDVAEGRGEADKAFDIASSMSSDNSVAASYWSSTASAETEGMHPVRSVSSLSSDESSTSGSETSFFADRLIASENLHPEISVGGGRATARNRCSVVLVHAKQFHTLRRMCCPSQLAYISSLSRSKRWDAQGGKSKALFSKTLDGRFIIKQIKKTELDSFLKFAPDYFRHISYSISSGSQTCLAKILGIYQVKQSRGGKEVKTDVVVMENVLYGRNFARVYDLKGAVFSRYISDADEPEKVLLDQNFIEDMRTSPMYIGGRNKHLFQRAIWNDTSFLTSINVMDYSLLVGVDKQRRELVFGIIDYLRQYTWDKQLETWVKSSLVVPKNSLPTVVSPKEYKKRFRNFMSKHFLTVPDTWSSEQYADSCDNGEVRSSFVENGHASQLTSVPST